MSDRKAGSPTSDERSLSAQRSSTRAVDAFLDKLAATPVVRTPGQRGRLIFALDATASRQPTWDTASRIQRDMFAATHGLGGLEVQVAWYRGFGEFYASRWLADAEKLIILMASVSCTAGETQLRKVLKHAVRETQQRKVNAVVFIGDAFEEEADQVSALAGELGLLGVPVFVFHEGDNPLAGEIFQRVARLSRGAVCRFDAASPTVLRELLNAVAIFAAGGLAALEKLGRQQGGEVLRLAHQMRGG